jgi:hypothetical protein
VEPRMTPDPGRVAALTALDRALADPVRLVQVLTGAADPDDGAARVAEAFGLTVEQGRVVCDNSFAQLTRNRRAQLAADVAELGQPWGPPLHLTAEVDAGVLTVEIGGRRLVAEGGRRRDRALDELGRLLVAEVARPQWRPVVVAVPGGVRMVVLPEGSVQFDRPEDRA